MNYSQNKDFKNWGKEFQSQWIKDGIDKKAVEYSDEFGKFLKYKNLSSSQIRNVYGELKRIQMKGLKNEKTAFLLLKPKLAYASVRDNSRGLKPLQEVFNKAFDAVDLESENAEKRFQNLMDFMEAVLAYHKAHGGN